MTTNDKLPRIIRARYWNIVLSVCNHPMRSLRVNGGFEVLYHFPKIDHKHNGTDSLKSVLFATHVCCPVTFLKGDYYMSFCRLTGKKKF